MRNIRRLSEVMLMGIILIATRFPANAQITKLFPVTEEVSLRASTLAKPETFSNEPYSEKIDYPPPPGVTLPTTAPTESDLSTTPSSPTESALSTTHSDKTITSNSSNLSKTPANTAEESFESVQIISPTKRISAPSAIEFRGEEAGLLLTTEGPFTTEEPSTTDATSLEELSTLTIRSKDATLTTESAIGNNINTSNKETNDSNDKTSTKETPINETNSTTSIALKPCTTPIGKNGECKNLLECPSLTKLLMREPLLVENKLYLQRSQCGLQNQTILTCCPDNVPEPTLSPKWSLLPNLKSCGFMVENRLYGGYHTEMDSFSWMALLEYSKGGNKTEFNCGGTLISDRYILTAAHCVTGLPKTWSIKSVRLGEWDISTEMDCTEEHFFNDCSDPPINVSVEEVIPHKDYLPTSKNQLHDIALIRLSTKVNFTDFIQPICLPHGENNLHAFDEQSLDLVGWGASPNEGLLYNIKEKATVHVLQLDKCRSKYSALKNITLEQSQFCVEGQLKNDTCRIDSGGPVVSFDTANKGLGRFYIGGIQSIGSSPCWSDEGLPGVYTRVAEYLDWILENIHD